MVERGQKVVTLLKQLLEGGHLRHLAPGRHSPTIVRSDTNPDALLPDDQELRLLNSVLASPISGVGIYLPGPNRLVIRNADEVVLTVRSLLAPKRGLETTVSLIPEYWSVWHPHATDYGTESELSQLWIRPKIPSLTRLSLVRKYPDDSPAQIIAVPQWCAVLNCFPNRTRAEATALARIAQILPAPICVFLNEFTRHVDVQKEIEVTNSKARRALRTLREDKQVLRKWREYDGSKEKKNILYELRKVRELLASPEFASWKQVHRQ